MAKMNWRSIRLELASTQEFPAGSVGRAYLIRLPLDDSDHVDAMAIADQPQKALVRRYWSADPDQHGVVQLAGHEWELRCDGGRRILKLNETPVRLGHSISVVEPDGTVLPFKIASVR